MFVKATTSVVGIFAAVAIVAPAQAEVFKDKGGTSSCTPVSNEEVMKRPDGSSIRRTVGACISASDGAYPFDHQKQMCTSTLELTADGKMVSVHGYCDVLSTKGDRAAYTITYNPDTHGRWEYFSGSGSYAGIKGGGTYKFKAGFPSGGGVYDWTGTWQIDGATAQK